MLPSYRDLYLEQNMQDGSDADRENYAEELSKQLFIENTAAVCNREFRISGYHWCNVSKM